MPLFDTHCHIHEIAKRLTPVYDKWQEKGALSAADVIADARNAGVQYMNCIGTSLADSELAVDFVTDKPDLYAAVGIHPHEASQHLDTATQKRFAALAKRPKVVAVGECGLDYFYSHSPREDQLKLLRFQIELALEHGLPLSFHVREAFDDFWPVFESYPAGSIRGVLHSYTDNAENLQRAINHGLYFGVNGIATFVKDESKRVIYRTIPQHLLLLETDAPFLTPVPFRGTICKPEHVAVTAEFVSELRQEPLEQTIAATTSNAISLFNIQTDQ